MLHATSNNSLYWYDSTLVVNWELKINWNAKLCWNVLASVVVWQTFCQVAIPSVTSSGVGNVAGLYCVPYVEQYHWYIHEMVAGFFHFLMCLEEVHLKCTQVFWFWRRRDHFITHCWYLLALLKVTCIVLINFSLVKFALAAIYKFERSLTLLKITSTRCVGSKSIS